MAVALDLIELDGKATPEALAAEIIRQNPEISVPVPIEEIAKEAGILEIQPLRSEGFEGMLLANAEKSEGIVFVNQNRPRQRQRFNYKRNPGDSPRRHKRRSCVRIKSPSKFSRKRYACPSWPSMITATLTPRLR